MIARSTALRRHRGGDPAGGPPDGDVLRVFAAAGERPLPAAQSSGGAQERPPLKKMKITLRREAERNWRRAAEPATEAPEPAGEAPEPAGKTSAALSAAAPAVGRQVPQREEAQEERWMGLPEASRLKRRLAEGLDVPLVLDALTSAEIGVDVLKSSGIAVEVKGLRSSADPGVRSTACALVSRWKSRIKTDREEGTGTNTPHAQASRDCSNEGTGSVREGRAAGVPGAMRATMSGRRRDAVREEGSIQLPAKAKRKEESREHPSSAIPDTIKPLVLEAPARRTGAGAAACRESEQRGGKMCRRERARQVLLRSLAAGAASASHEDLKRICSEIESAVWTRLAVGASPDVEAYISKIQTLKFNLSRNASLCQELVDGIVTGAEVSSMPTQALAGASTKDKRKQNFSDAAFQDSMWRTAKEGGAQSRDFTCPACGARDALFRHEHLLPDNFWSYNDTAYQVLIECNACAHEWRE